MNQNMVMFMGIFAIFYGLLEVLAQKEFLSCSFFILFGLEFFISGFYGSRGYFNKTYFLIDSSVIALLGLIIMYSVFFIPSTDMGNVYFVSIVFFVLVILQLHLYIHRREGIMMIWKDEGNTLETEIKHNGYLVCNKCNRYYELQVDESPEDFSDQCECGGKLQYQDRF